MRTTEELVGQIIEASLRGEGFLAFAILLMAFLASMGAIAGAVIIACQVIQHWN